jgi:hypothetical protein
MRVPHLVIPALVGLAACPVFAAAPPAQSDRRTTTPTKQHGPNAAPLYREAFKLLDSLNEADRGRLGMCGKDGCWVITTPLDQATVDLLARQERTIELARRAAGMADVRWELEGDSQKMVELANHAPRLSALMVLQARSALRDGKTQKALDDLVVAFTISRDAAAEVTLVTKLAEISAWRPAAELLAQQLPTLPKESVMALKAKLA